MNSLRVLFAIEARKNMNMQTFDVKTAFLYGDLEEENYMEIPEGYKNTGKICLLKKALYGLRQAPSQWNKKLTTFLKEEGLNQLKSDQCIFKNDANSLFMAIHVDDGIIMGEDERQIEEILLKLENQFQITKTTNPKVYLGIQIEATRWNTYLSNQLCKPNVGKIQHARKSRNENTHGHDHTNE